METILIVDDEPEVCAAARDMLKAKGYTTLDTGDPTLALRIARTESQPIHLLLTDVVMPLMNGRELIDQMRAIRPAPTGRLDRSRAYPLRWRPRGDARDDAARDSHWEVTP